MMPAVMLRALSLGHVLSPLPAKDPYPVLMLLSTLPLRQLQKGIHVDGIACCDAVTRPGEGGQSTDCMCAPWYYGVC
ncbi:hypothetical protein HDV57DRAFT_497557 [Trichoderma longibrachiatum]